MIARIRGRVVQICGNEIIVMTSGGVGYRLVVPTGVVPGDASLPDGPTPPPEVFLRVHHQLVERQGDVLFGFSTQAQERLFHLLVSVPKIGGSTAVKIMSAADVVTVLTAISTGDTAALVAVKGVGRKMADNIIHACRDKARILVDALVMGGSAEPGSGSMLDAVLEAIVTSGFKREDAVRVVRNLSVTAGATLASLLASSLRELDGG